MGSQSGWFRCLIKSQGYNAGGGVRQLSRPVRLLSLLVLLVVVPPLWGDSGGAGKSQAVTWPEIIKSPGDQYLYRYLELPNKLRVLLISNSKADKAAASLDIYVGSAQDPGDREGLAHFLEHMLFLGTEKYPDAGEYQAFISANGGSHNAYTAAEHTNYFFDIKAGMLTPALDRFAEFFVAPLFTEAYVDRERHAVNSEYKAKIKDDYRRTLDVYRQVFNPEHPMAKFSVGSLDTLADRIGSEDATAEDASVIDRVRDDLLAFYQRYYSAELMTLVVMGRESLDELEALVRPRFGAIPSHPVTSLHHGQALFETGFLPAEVHIKPEKKQHRLTLMFPLPPVQQYYHEKPLRYLGNLLGHEGEGSLLALLKQEGWAEGLSAGEGQGDRDGTLFDISIALTPQGVDAKEQIIALVFEAVNNIRRQGIEQWRFDEQRQLGEIAFQFREQGEPIHTTSRLAYNLHHYSPEDVLRGGYRFARYDADLITDYLAYLRPDNMFVALHSPELETDQITQRYATPYRLLSRPQKLTVPVQSLARQLRLPEKNAFIPQQLQVKSPPTLEERAETPLLLRDTDNFQAWFKQDYEFEVPKANLFMRVKSPEAAASVQGAVNMRLFTAMVTDALNQFAYPAALAGLQFSIDANSRGFDLYISGYNDRMGLLLTRILDAVVDPRFSKKRFDSIKRETLRRWGNARKRPPYVQLLNDLPSTLFSPYWSEPVLIAAAEGQTFKQLQRFSRRLLKGARVDALLQGNLYREEGLKLATLIERRLLRKLRKRPIVEAQVVNLHGSLEDDSRPWLRNLAVDHRDNAVALYVQGSEDSIEDMAHMLVLRQVLKAPFFNELRTEKQLGYIVFVSGMGLKEVPGSVLVVQSPTATAEQLVGEIAQFIDHFAGSLGEQTFVQQLSQHRQAVIHQLQEQPKNQAEQARFYWENILHQNFDFNRRQLLVKAVNSVRAESFARYFQRVLQSPERRIWMTSRAPVAISGQYAPIESQEQFKASQPLYRYP